MAPALGDAGEGGDAFPLSYGISTTLIRDGLRMESALHLFPIAAAILRCGCRTFRAARRRKLLANSRSITSKPVGKLSISVLDASGRPTAARVFVTGEDGRAYAPDDAWMHADDNFVRAERPFEAHYFHITGNADLTLPVGHVDVEVMKGFEYRFERKSVTIAANKIPA